MGARSTPHRRTAATDGDDDRRLVLEGEELVVVSNRQPYRHDYGRGDDGEQTIVVERPTGGLTAGLDPVMQQTSGTWIAWGDGDADPDVVDTNSCVTVPPDENEYTLRRVWLDGDEVDEYYYGYSNQVLWPLCHDAVDLMRPRERYWDRYRAVNEKFAAAVLECIGEEPIVWFQDYHLALAPRFVRDGAPDGAFLAHFWHIPWPHRSTFRACPQREALLRSLLANDLLGFHSSRYCENFLRCVESALDDASVDWEGGYVDYRGVRTFVRAFPMGVDAAKIDRIARIVDADDFRQEVAADLGIPEGVRVALGVDRLDYTKGIDLRLAALEHLWETRPQWRGRFTFVQNATESRSRIPDYQAVQTAVETAVERINDRFGTDDWRPVVYTTDRLPKDDLYGLYRHSDVAIVSPVCDGMNLVAQEYVAAQVDGNGVLVLSDRAGAHDVLGEDTLTISPHATETFAARIEQALGMPDDERRRRMIRLRQRVFEHDLSAWMDDIFETVLELRRAGRARPVDGA